MCTCALCTQMHVEIVLWNTEISFIKKKKNLLSADVGVAVSRALGEESYVVVCLKSV